MEINFTTPITKLLLRRYTVNAKAFAYAYLVALATGFLMAPVAYLSAVSGLCLRDPSLLAAFFGLVEGYAHCSYLHLSFAPLPLVVLGCVHYLATLIIVYERVLRGAPRALRVFYEAYLIASFGLTSHLAALYVATFT